MLYEIGDPAAYILPDVVCDFTRRHASSSWAPSACAVSGARGRPPHRHVQGFGDLHGRLPRCAASLMIVGIDAVAKARRTGDAILERTRRDASASAGWPDFTASEVEVHRRRSLLRPAFARARGAREVLMRVTVDHPMKQALDIFAREIAPAGTSWSPGTTGARLRASGFLAAGHACSPSRCRSVRFRCASWSMVSRSR